VQLKGLFDASILLSSAYLRRAIALSLFLGLVPATWAAVEKSEITDGRLTQVSLEQLGKIKVTTESKRPVKVSQTPSSHLGFYLIIRNPQVIHDLLSG
jgi:hypothetical protein